MNKVIVMGIVISLLFFFLIPHQTLNAETVEETPQQTVEPATTEEKATELLKSAVEEQKNKKENAGSTDVKPAEKPKKEVVRNTKIAIDARTWANTMTVESVWYVDLDEIHVYIYCPEYINHEQGFLESNCYEYLRMWLNGFDWVTYNTYTKTKEYMHYSKPLPNGQMVNMYEARFRLNRI